MDKFKLVRHHGETPQQFLERAVKTAYNADFEYRKTDKKLRKSLKNHNQLEKKYLTLIREHKAALNQIKMLEAAELQRPSPEKSSRQKCKGRKENDIKREY